METPVRPRKAESVRDGETESKCEQSFATAAGVGGFFLLSQGDSVAVMGTGASANLACFSWLARRSRIPERRGIPNEVPLWR